MNECTKTGCYNRGKLVLDANVVRYILGGTVDMVGKKYGGEVWDRKLPHVIAVTPPP